MREQLGGGNPEAYEGACVCAGCFADEGLKGCIEGAARAKTCRFCGAESDEPISAPLVEVLLHIKESLDREYDVAENKLPYDERQYVGKVWTTRELLDHLGIELPNDEDGSLMDALCDGLGERLWCDKHPFSLSDDQRLTFSWDEFCELVKHRRRYFFLREERDDDELYSPLALLKALAKWCEEFSLVKTLPAASRLWRARPQKAGEVFSSAADLGPPPQDKTTMSNRMSPSGIVMFYVSDNSETALRERAKDPAKDVGEYAIGEFKTLREMKILDLAEIPAIPSIFEPVSDTLEYDPRPPAIFLNYFATELSKPIARDRSIHVEYIPTQVITEYFRTEFLHEGQKIDGIRYRSARDSDHCSLVLFATQDDLVDGSRPVSGAYASSPDPWIELTRREQRHVTADDLEQWEREAPTEIEWIW